MFENDRETFDFVKDNLYVAAVCDILDFLDYREQAMHQRLRPLLPDARKCGFVGRARTIRWMETDYIESVDPYGLELEAVDSLRAGDVVVNSTDYAGTNVPWGELMTTVAMKNGAVGCVCDSNIRDATRIIDLGFPVYYTGIKPVDSKGRGIVKAFDVPVQCGDVRVQSGDLVFADFDGIVVAPPEVESEVLRLALEKVSKENAARQDLIDGKTLRATFEKFGVL
jgi:regulator of RNase E activity RraA